MCKVGKAKPTKKKTRKLTWPDPDLVDLLAPQICHVDTKQGSRRKKRKKATYPGTHLPTSYLFFEICEVFRCGLGKHFGGVFELVMQKNGQKRDKKKMEGKK
jgi:hypothetical protein